MWDTLRRNYSEDLVRKARNMKLTSDRKGAVFDFPTSELKIFEKVSEGLTDGLKVHKCEVLPEIIDNEMRRQNYGN